MSPHAPSCMERRQRVSLNRKDGRISTNSGNTFVLGILLGAILVVSVAAVVTEAGNGRFDGFRLGSTNEFIIFDTQSGHTWRRSGGKMFDLGTPEEPKLKISTVPLN